ncbi:MAG: prepilin-type N-terminal cleavage/methylation domain-containing protein [Candidatus Omnitrophica bacterium]|nr:prepilin-type N-terminal cleavage/methylation domain-containing protein [Candidatus Omnitrophota bacterium]
MKLRSNKAFSLLEVLIAAGILATVVVFVFRSFSAALSATRLSQNMSLACMLVQAKVWEIESGVQALPFGSETIQNKIFNWKYEFRDTDVPGLRQLSLTVSWKESAREKEYTLDFLTYMLEKG